MSHKTVTEPGARLGAHQLASLLDSTQELIAILDSDSKVLFANESFRHSLGYSPDELLGRSIQAIVHAADVEHIRERLQEVAALPGSSVRERCRLRTQDSSWRWFEIVFHNRLHDSGIAGILLNAQDVTALQRMESERQVISDVVHALNQTSNLDQLLTGIHDALKRIVSAQNCFVALHDPEHDTFEFPFFADEYDTVPPPQRVGRSCTAYVFRTGRAMLIPQSDFDRLVALNEVELVGSPAPAWLGVPLKTPTATIGVLVVQHYQNESAYDMRDLEFLDSVGGHIALAIERRRSEEALRKSESVFRLLFSHNPLPTWVMDDESLRFIQVNDAAVKQYGFAAEEFSRMTLSDIRPEEKSASMEVRPQKVDADGRYQGVCKHRKKDGKDFEVELISHEFDYAGRKVRLVVAQDISERHL